MRRWVRSIPLWFTAAFQATVRYNGSSSTSSSSGTRSRFSRRGDRNGCDRSSHSKEDGTGPMRRTHGAPTDAALLASDCVLGAIAQFVTLHKKSSHLPQDDGAFRISVSCLADQCVSKWIYDGAVSVVSLSISDTVEDEHCSSHNAATTSPSALLRLQELPLWMSCNITHKVTRAPSKTHEEETNLLRPLRGDGGEADESSSPSWLLRLDLLLPDVPESLSGALDAVASKDTLPALLRVLRAIRDERTHHVTRSTASCRTTWLERAQLAAVLSRRAPPCAFYGEDSGATPCGLSQHQQPDASMCTPIPKVKGISTPPVDRVLQFSALQMLEAAVIRLVLWVVKRLAGSSTTDTSALQTAALCAVVGFVDDSTFKAIPDETPFTTQLMLVFFALHGASRSDMSELLNRFFPKLTDYYASKHPDVAALRVAECAGMWAALILRLRSLKFLDDTNDMWTQSGGGTDADASSATQPADLLRQMRSSYRKLLTSLVPVSVAASQSAATAVSTTIPSDKVLCNVLAAHFHVVALTLWTLLVAATPGLETMRLHLQNRSTSLFFDEVLTPVIFFITTNVAFDGSGPVSVDGGDIRDDNGVARRHTRDVAMNAAAFWLWFASDGGPTVHAIATPDQSSPYSFASADETSVVRVQKGNPNGVVAARLWPPVASEGRIHRSFLLWLYSSSVRRVREMTVALERSGSCERKRGAPQDSDAAPEELSVSLSTVTMTSAVMMFARTSLSVSGSLVTTPTSAGQWARDEAAAVWLEATMYRTVCGSADDFLCLGDLFGQHCHCPRIYLLPSTTSFATVPQQQILHLSALRDAAAAWQRSVTRRLHSEMLLDIQTPASPAAAVEGDVVLCKDHATGSIGSREKRMLCLSTRVAAYRSLAALSLMPCDASVTTSSAWLDRLVDPVQLDIVAEWWLRLFTAEAAASTMGLSWCETNTNRVDEIELLLDYIHWQLILRGGGSASRVWQPEPNAAAVGSSEVPPSDSATVTLRLFSTLKRLVADDHFATSLSFRGHLLALRLGLVAGSNDTRNTTLFQWRGRLETFIQGALSSTCVEELEARSPKEVLTTEFRSADGSCGQWASESLVDSLIQAASAKQNPPPTPTLPPPTDTAAMTTVNRMVFCDLVAFSTATLRPLWGSRPHDGTEKVRTEEYALMRCVVYACMTLCRGVESMPSQQTPAMCLTRTASLLVYVGTQLMSSWLCFKQQKQLPESFEEGDQPRVHPPPDATSSCFRFIERLVSVSLELTTTSAAHGDTALQMLLHVASLCAGLLGGARGCSGAAVNEHVVFLMSGDDAKRSTATHVEQQCDEPMRNATRFPVPDFRDTVVLLIRRAALAFELSAPPLAALHISHHTQRKRNTISTQSASALVENILQFLVALRSLSELAALRIYVADIDDFIMRIIDRHNLLDASSEVCFKQLAQFSLDVLRLASLLSKDSSSILCSPFGECTFPIVAAHLTRALHLRMRCSSSAAPPESSTMSWRQLVIDADLLVSMAEQAAEAVRGWQNVSDVSPGVSTSVDAAVGSTAQPQRRDLAAEQLPDGGVSSQIQQHHTGSPQQRSFRGYVVRVAMHNVFTDLAKTAIALASDSDVAGDKKKQLLVVKVASLAIRALTTVLLFHSAAVTADDVALACAVCSCGVFRVAQKSRRGDAACGAQDSLSPAFHLALSHISRWWTLVNASRWIGARRSSDLLFANSERRDDGAVSLEFTWQRGCDDVCRADEEQARQHHAVCAALAHIRQELRAAVLTALVDYRRDNIEALAAAGMWEDVLLLFVGDKHVTELVRTCLAQMSKR